jgi:hypothetical protein
MKRARAWLACLPWLATIATGAAGADDPFAHPATAAELRQVLAQPAARLESAQVLTGHFEHARELREIPKPLIARGEFLFARGLGVHWHTVEPFDSVVLLMEDGVFQSDAGGPLQRVAGEDQPAVRVVAQIFKALFTLDLASLERNFELSGVSRDGHWTLGLKPRTRALRRMFSQATVAGTQDVEQVVLTDSRGDRTVIELRDTRHSPDPPGADVRARFAPAR